MERESVTFESLKREASFFLERFVICVGRSIESFPIFVSDEIQSITTFTAMLAIEEPRLNVQVAMLLFEAERAFVGYGFRRGTVKSE